MRAHLYVQRPTVETSSLLHHSSTLFFEAGTLQSNPQLAETALEQRNFEAGITGESYTHVLFIWGSELLQPSCMKKNVNH